MHIQAPILTPCCVPTKVLALCSFVDVIEVANFGLALTSHFFLKLVTASVVQGGSFWAGDDKAAVWGVFTGCCVCGIAHIEKETFTFSGCELDEHEIVAVCLPSTLFLTSGFIFNSRYGSKNVGYWVERAGESAVEEVTLGCNQSCQAAAHKEEDQHWKFGQHGLTVVS